MWSLDLWTFSCDAIYKWEIVGSTTLEAAGGMSLHLTFQLTMPPLTHNYNKQLPPLVQATKHLCTLYACMVFGGLLGYICTWWTVHDMCLPSPIVWLWIKCLKLRICSITIHAHWAVQVPLVLFSLVVLLLYYCCSYISAMFSYCIIFYNHYK